MSAQIIQFAPAEIDNPPVDDVEDYLAEFIARFPFDDISDQFQRGMLSGLMTAYEVAGFDRADVRYLAGGRLLERMARIVFQ